MPQNHTPKAAPSQALQLVESMVISLQNICSRSIACSLYQLLTDIPGLLPTFPQTSSSDLDTLLSTFRTNIFLPSYLRRAQQNLIYRKHLHRLLLGDDPINIELRTSLPGNENETFTLVPLDRTKEPNTKASFHKLLDLLKTKSDWDILPAFLQGLKDSGRKVKQDMAEKMVRHAVKAGRMGIMVECLRMVGTTGIKLDHVGLAREVMLGALATAYHGGWSEEALAKAVRQAEGMLVLMEDPLHVPADQAPQTLDPQRAPDVIGLAMGLTAVQAVKFGEGKDEARKVEKYARKVLQLWKNAELGLPVASWHDANRELIMWGPVEQAMIATLRVLGEQSEIGKQISTVLRESVQPRVERAKEILLSDRLSEEQRRGPILYEELSRALP